MRMFWLGAVFLGLLAGARPAPAGEAPPGPVETSPGSGNAAESIDLLKRRSETFRDVARRVRPAVVHIRCLLAGGGIGMGSGVIIDTDGFVLTSYHVVRNALKIQVHLEDRRMDPAQLISFDPVTDLALLHLEEDHLTCAVLGDSDRVEVGDWVLAIGSPLGFQQTVTAGIISVLERDFSGEEDDPYGGFPYFIQTDAAVYEGSSGGPLLNLDGEVIAITHSAALVRRGYTGLAFGTPINFVKNVLDAMKEGRGAPRGELGAGLKDIDTAMAEALGLPRSRGALVQYVLPDSDAARANLMTGDAILRLEWVDPPHDRLVRTEVRNRVHLRNLIACAPIGPEIALAYFRDGHEAVSRFALHDALTILEDRKLLGIAVMDLTKVWADQLGLESPQGALVVAVISKGIGQGTSLRPGMVISAINTVPIPDIRAYRAAAEQMAEAQTLQLAINLRGRLYLLQLVRDTGGGFRPAHPSAPGEEKKPLSEE
ncbi:MAG: trypsin-like peptidase domain-containing protein [Planctomycetota bacterium]